MANKKKIREALAALDPANHSDWTDDGMPALDAVSTLLGENVKRADVTAAAPGFTREHREFEPSQKADAPETQSVDAAEVRAQEAQKREAAALSLKERLEAKRGEVAEARKKRDEADREWNRLVKELDALTSEYQASAPKMTQSDRVAAVHAAELASRRVSAPVDGGMDLDKALSIRKPAVRPSTPLVGAQT